MGGIKEQVHSELPMASTTTLVVLQLPIVSAEIYWMATNQSTQQGLSMVFMILDLIQHHTLTNSLLTIPYQTLEQTV